MHPPSPSEQDWLIDRLAGVVATAGPAHFLELGDPQAPSCSGCGGAIRGKIRRPQERLGVEESEP